MDYYKVYIERYKTTPKELQKQSREYWTKVHAENMQSGRHDLIIFSAQILAAITAADAGKI